MKKLNISCIYKITNTVNNKIYVGQTKNFNRRIEEYKHKSKNITKKSKYRIMLEIEKYGFHNFKFSVLERVDDISILDEREIYWISKLDSRNPDIGYNSKTGGKSCGKMTDYSKALMSESSRAFRHSDETKKKKSIPIIAIHFTDQNVDIQWYQSAKIFSDIIRTDRTVVTRSIRKGQKIFGFFVFYADEQLREEAFRNVIHTKSQKKHGKNFFDYVESYKLLQEMCRD